LGILPSEYVQVGQGEFFHDASILALVSHVLLDRILVGSNKYATKFETEFRLLRTGLEQEEWILQKQKELEAIQEASLGLISLNPVTQESTKTLSMLSCVFSGVGPHRVIATRNWMLFERNGRKSEPTCLSTLSVSIQPFACINSIIARLSTLGWGEEAILMDKKYESEFSAHRLIKQAKKLTDHGTTFIANADWNIHPM
jgi:hypothetical protein